MALKLDSGKKRGPEMNVTPLVDVVLVLLIIFMVVTPLLVSEFWTHIPKQEKKEVKQQNSKREKPLVLQILPGVHGAYAIVGNPDLKRGARSSSGLTPPSLALSIASTAKP